MQSRLQIIPSVLSGQGTTVRLLIRHPMETGFRFDINGTPIPKNVIHTLAAQLNGIQIFKATLDSGISADPFFQFEIKASQGGKLILQWTDDLGRKGEAVAEIKMQN